MFWMLISRKYLLNFRVKGISLDNSYPLMICQPSNVSSSPIEDIYSIRIPVQLNAREPRSCSAYSLILTFTVFHACCDCVTLVTERFNSLITYLDWHNHQETPPGDPPTHSTRF